MAVPCACERRLGGSPGTQCIQVLTAANLGGMAPSLQITMLFNGCQGRSAITTDGVAVVVAATRVAGGRCCALGVHDALGALPGTRSQVEHWRVDEHWRVPGGWLHAHGSAGEVASTDAARGTGAPRLRVARRDAGCGLRGRTQLLRPVQAHASLRAAFCSLAPVCMLAVICCALGRAPRCALFRDAEHTRLSLLH